MEEFLFKNRDNSVNLELRRTISKTFNKEIINFYEINLSDLKLEKNISELADKFYAKHNKIFVENYTIGTVAAIKNNECYRVIIVLA